MGKARHFWSSWRASSVEADHVAYIGNDLNDLACFDLAGWSVAVADAYPEVLRRADHVLSKPGGYGALREVCELILARLRNAAASEEETSTWHVK